MLTTYENVCLQAALVKVWGRLTPEEALAKALVDKLAREKRGK